MFGGNKFQILGVEQSLTDSCCKIGWTEPTEIQKKVIPLMLKGNDVIALAETGSGKTGAFALPILQKLFLKPKYNFALILTPTHELAVQIKNEFMKLGEEVDLKVVTLLGGDFVDDQIKLLKSNKFHIVIGTPGRICLHINKTKLLNFKSLNFFILDEADRMLNDDFLTDIETIVSFLPKVHQTCLFSATMTNKLEKLETVCIKNPIRVEVSRKHQTVGKLIQEFVVVTDDIDRILFVVWKLQSTCINSDETELSSAIVFVESKHWSKLLCGILKDFDISSVSLNSDMIRSDREEALESFSKGKVSVLVATDVASRGLDIRSVGLVINFNVPESSKNYQHRVGRTARAGRSGLAITLASISSLQKLSSIEKDLGIKMGRIKKPRKEMGENRSELMTSFKAAKRNLKEQEIIETDFKKEKAKKKRNLKRNNDQIN